MLPRPVLFLVCSAVLLGGAGATRADVTAPGERAVPSEVVFTGLVDFPAYRFVAAVSSFPSDPGSWSPPDRRVPPTPVREGEPALTSSPFFQELRAIPADTPEPVTDAWVLASQAPTSGTFTRHPMRVPETSSARASRARFQVRQIQGGWIALELLSNAVVDADGSERPVRKVIPRSYVLASVAAPPGWQLFLMPDPSWPRIEPPPPAIRCKAGDVLPLSPMPRTLVAVEGAPGPDGSLSGRAHVSWGRRLDSWGRDEVSPDSAAQGRREVLEIQVEPGHKLNVTAGESYQDARGRWFYDESMALPVDPPEAGRWAWWAACGGGAGALALAAGIRAWRRRGRT